MSGRKEKSSIPRTALAQIRYRKSSGILIGISIMLTAALIMIIGSCGYGTIRFQRENIRTVAGDFHGGYGRIDVPEYERIKSNPAFDKVGGSQIIAQAESDGMTGYMYVTDGDFQEMINRFPLAEGRMPVRENEIVAPDYFLRQIGYEGVVGEEITLTYRVLGIGEYVEQKFTVSGLTFTPEINKLSGNFACLVSEQYADSVVAPEDRDRTVYFKIKGEQEYNADTMEAAIKQITAEMGIDDKYLSLNTMYLALMLSLDGETVAVVVILIILVVFFSSLVIYNIFYVGLVGRIQEFGKIRALGADKRQMKGMVLLEGLLIGGIAVPLGIVLGGLLSQAGFGLLVYELQEIEITEPARINLWNPAIILLTAAVSFLTIWISLRKPMRIAARISPVEAMRHSASVAQQKKKRRSKTGKAMDYRNVSLSRLVSANLKRNQKRTVTTILTLGLSSILFIVTANVGSSISAEDVTRWSIEKGDFLISLDYALHDETYPENNLYAMQERGLLDDAFAEAVKAVPGVKEVEVRKGIAFKNITLSEKFDEDHYGIITAITPEEWEKEKNYIVSGESDYERLAEQEGIVYTWTSADRLEMNEYEIGKSVSMILLNGQAEIPVQREVSAFTESARTEFDMPLSGFEQLGLEGNTNYQLFITCEPGMTDEAAAGLNELIAQEEAYEMIDYREQYQLSELSVKLVVYPVYGLLIALGFIGFMNMANTIITSIITRKQELGVLQAIGLTNRQMARMLQMEGLVFTIGTLCLSLTLGNGLGYAAYCWARDNHIMAIHNYHFPIIEEAIFVGAILLLQLVLSWYCSRMIRKEGIIERVRHSE